MNNKFCIALLFLLIFQFAFGQSDTAKKSSPEKKLTHEEVLKKVNKLQGDGSFSAAIPYWLEVLGKEPQNNNYNFKTGFCYRNTYDEQYKALTYFKNASKNLSENYSYTSSKETKAPLDVYYFIGESYLAKNNPDSALLYFTLYRDKFKGQPPIDVNRVIMNCVNAQAAAKKPRDVTILKIGGGVNTNFVESNPVVTVDNSLMLFVSRRVRKDGSNEKTIDRKTGKMHEDIYIAKKDAKGRWENAGLFKLNTDGNEAPLYLSPDGLTLYLRKEVKGNSDIYFSKFAHNVWSKPQKMKGGINSAANENGLSISGDGKYLYFSSNREGSNGKFDIYQCVRTDSLSWSKPRNLGSVINSGGDEMYPFIHPDGKTLFFSSNGYSSGMGGLDIYFSEMKPDGSWSEPENIGYPINTTKDDLNYYITSGGTRYYTTLHGDQSYEVYQVTGGGFAVENINIGSEVVTLTQEMNVTEVLEVVKEKEVEVEVVETIETVVKEEKEIEVVDLTALDELQKQIDNASTERVKAEAEKAKVEAEKARAEADKLKAEAEIKKAEADIANAEKVKAEAEILKAKAEIEKAVAEKAKADSAIARANADKTKAEADKAKAEQVIKEAEAKIAKAEQVKAEASAKKAEAEKAKADAQRSKTDAVTAKENRISEEAKAKAAEAQAKKAQSEALMAEKDKIKAEQLKSQATISQAEADKAISERERKKAEAEIKHSEAEKAKAEAVREKAKAEAAKIALKKEKLKSKEQQKKKGNVLGD